MQNPYEIDLIHPSSFKIFSNVRQTINKRTHRVDHTEDDISNKIKKIKLTLNNDIKKVNSSSLINTIIKKRKYNEL
jgi:hypothetical protein|tara:strand:+ start:453 stop:680 length:228 start_codon:yes stop_codon:yes gene_type:complete